VRVRRTLLGALTLALGMGAVAAPATAGADGIRDTTHHARGRILFEGDSITDWYNNRPGSSMQGWWSILAQRLRLRPDASNAEGNSGFTQRGDKNPEDRVVRHNGTTLIQRLPAIASRVASDPFFVIEAGVNDGKTESIARVRRAVDRYFAAVAELRDTTGKDRSTVFVLTPWPHGINPSGRARVVRIIGDLAGEYGFTAVDMTGVLNSRNTRRLHPTRRGSEAIAERFLRKTDITELVDTLRNQT